MISVHTRFRHLLPKLVREQTSQCEERVEVNGLGCWGADPPRKIRNGDWDAEGAFRVEPLLLVALPELEISGIRVGNAGRLT